MNVSFVIRDSTAPMMKHKPPKRKQREELRRGHAGGGGGTCFPVDPVVAEGASIALGERARKVQADARAPPGRPSQAEQHALFIGIDSPGIVPDGDVDGAVAGRSLDAQEARLAALTGHERISGIAQEVEEDLLELGLPDRDGKPQLAGQRQKDPGGTQCWPGNRAQRSRRSATLQLPGADRPSIPRRSRNAIAEAAPARRAPARA